MCNYVKKYLSVIISSLLMIASMYSLMSYAVGNPRNPNGDSVINMADSVYIQQYLDGNLYPINLTALDFDQNGIISQMDSYKIQRYLLNQYTPPNQNENDPIEYGVATTRYYRKHDYSSSNAYSYSEYSISPNVSINSVEENTRTIFGSNDMIRDYDTSVVRLSIGGTGFIVNNHVIATAAHCVYSIETDEFFDLNIQIVDSDNTTIQTIYPKYSHIPKSFAQLSEYNSNFDYALIYVEEDLSQYGMFKLGTALDDYVDSNGQVTVSGFPQTYPAGYQNSEYGLRFKATGNVLSSSNSYLLRYDADMTGGDSGGPVYVEEGITIDGILKEYKTAVAINVSQNVTTNNGVRINGDILRFFYSNINLS